EECGFPVTVRLDLRETDIEFAKGGFTAIVNLEGYFYTEDGLQLINDANYRFHVNAAEDEFTFTGVLDRFIDADTGRVLVKDTGFVLFTPDNVITHGPHPTLEEPGFDLCAALT